MTPMIDVTFLLLIFFMVTLKFKTLEGKLNAFLPKDVGVNTAVAEELEKVEIVLRVGNAGNKLNADGQGPWNGKGRYVFDSTRVVNYSVGPMTTTDLDKVHQRLKDLNSKDPEMPATLDARSGIIYADVVRLLDVALDANFAKITFAGAYPEPKK
jgi:biopolymer transport protein ExbD